MADCHDLLQKYHDKIRLTNHRIENLRDARDAIRNRIKDYFIKTPKEPAPNFKMQGSLAMKSTVNPLSGEYDIDDGIYLNNLDSDKNNWPSTATVHKWIYDAVDGHTDEKPTDKRTCIRVTYSGNYHVDLPIYGIENEASYLAEKGDEGWHTSEPGEFTDWFVKKVNDNDEQLRRMVRYIKAWADYDSRKGKLPTSIILTVLVANNYQYNDRDDACFARIITRIDDNINYPFAVFNPVDLTEDLARRLSESNVNHFSERIAALLKSASEALQEDDKEKACKKWREQFGDRFPECEGLKDNLSALKTSAPAILRNDSRSA